MPIIGARTDANAAARARRDSEIARLFQEALCGSAKAFAGLVTITRPRLLAAIRRIQSDPTEAEDILQDVYVKAWSARPTFDAVRGTAVQWLLGIARHSAVDCVRATARRPRFVPQDGDECPYASFAAEQAGPRDSAESRELVRAVQGCVKQLDSAHRHMLVLSFWNDMTHREIARAPGRPLGTVKSWLRRSIVSMRDSPAPHAL